MENLFIQSTILVISLGILIYFSDKLIDASVKLAKAYRISDAVIGLTLLAYGTSMPELTVSSISSIGLHPELSISNVIGSNIANIALVIGLAAFVRPFSVKEKQLAKRDNYIMVASTLMLVSMFVLFQGINRIAGFLMVLFVLGYTFYAIRHDRTHLNLKKDGSVSKLKETGIVLLCLLIIVASGKFAVDSAVSVAKGLGVTEWVIGATVIAIGTTLPELAVSLTAAKKGFFGMSIGNIVGSNIFNILWVLGFASSLGTIAVDFNMIKVDSLILLFVTLLFAYQIIRVKFSRMTGILYMVIYVSYLAYLLAY
ncbi:MAG: calcium/sodium antiporter [Candidatus Methanoperedenaceae archaeon]|nr:calcium/sodium antiporter [Candidatus Methanoperedenaceae archaeon]